MASQRDYTGPGGEVPSLRIGAEIQLRVLQCTECTAQVSSGEGSCVHFRAQAIHHLKEKHPEIFRELIRAPDELLTWEPPFRIVLEYHFEVSPGLP